MCRSKSGRCLLSCALQWPAEAGICRCEGWLGPPSSDPINAPKVEQSLDCGNACQGANSPRALECQELREECPVCCRLRAGRSGSACSKVGERLCAPALQSLICLPLMGRRHFDRVSSTCTNSGRGMETGTGPGKGRGRGKRDRKGDGQALGTVRPCSRFQAAYRSGMAGRAKRSWTLAVEMGL